MYLNIARSICIVLPLLSFNAHSLQIAPIISGWCHTTLPDKSEETDDLNIRCVGLPKQAEQQLIDELTLIGKYRSIRVSSLLNQANDWVDRYFDLHRFIDDLSPSDAKTFESINALILKNDLSRAEKLLTGKISSSKQASNEAITQYLIGTVRLLQFRSSQANRHFESAYRLQPQNPYYILAYIDTLINNINYPEAQRFIFEHTPEWNKLYTEGDERALIYVIDSLNALRTTYLKIAYYEKADDTLSQLADFIGSAPKLNSNSDSTPFGNKFYSLGQRYYSDNKLKIAKIALQNSVEILMPVCNSTRDYQCIVVGKARTLLAAISIKEKDVNSAIDEFKKAIDATNLAHTDIDLNNIWRPSVYYEIAHAYSQLEDSEQANNYWEKIADLWKNRKSKDSDYIFLIAHALNALGEHAASTDKRDRAQKYFEEAQSLSETTSSGGQSVEFAAAVFNLAQLYMDRSDMKAANAYSLQSTPLYYDLWRAQPKNYSDRYYHSLMILGLSNISLNEIHMGCENLRFLHLVDGTGQWTQESQQSFNQYCIPSEDEVEGKTTIQELN